MLVLKFIIIILYCSTLLLLFLFSLGQLHLAWYYTRHRKKSKPSSFKNKENEWPKVTVQLPVYNEVYVIDRLIKAVVNLDYPKHLLEIQVLDDSTDETSLMIEELLSEYQPNVDIKHIRREHRTGFKAGALQNGLGLSNGDLIAIFDADFIPDKDFLKKTVGEFKNNNIGLVQARWGHVNQDFSMLTKLQAFGLDAHFSIEQIGRSEAGSFINFNGTAGVWRKKCIIDAGGWSADTLTEDLDLSYRAQINGWKFKYIEEVVAPAELPIVMSAVKSQQYRWNKGAVETAKKNLGRVLNLNISLINKIHAICHLLNSSVFVLILTAAVLSIPMLFIKFSHPGLGVLFDIGLIFLAGFLSIGIFYWIASRRFKPDNPRMHFLKLFPSFLTVSMGLSLHNSIAVLEGLFGLKTPFIRTPKFNVIDIKDSWKGNKYLKYNLSISTFLEGLLAIYFIGGIIIGILLGDFGLLFFHIMLAVGFGSVFLYSIIPLKNA